jgi:glyoxylase-like metal-dependent hydrolase (beta-lactamase superfamily II)
VCHFKPTANKMKRLLLYCIIVLFFGCTSTKNTHDTTQINNPVYSDNEEIIYYLQSCEEEGSCSCYLIKSDSGFILIDAGSYKIRNKLLNSLSHIGCNPENLKLVILTHGHFDHTGNAQYFQKNYKAKILIHENDLEMVEKGIVPLKNRKFRPFYLRIMKPIFLFFYKSTINDLKDNFETFEPDILIKDDLFNLKPYGFNADIIHIPGHSSGSIGIITENRNFFSGDIMVNFRDKPAYNYYMADENFDDLDKSIEKVKKLNIKRVFPGHGRPFNMETLKNK